MQIVEVKNNLVKVSYDNSTENLVTSGFAVIKSAAQSFIAQIIHLEANANGTFAILKLLFNFNDDGVITTYNGAIPDLDSPAEAVPTRELLEILPIQNPIILGDLAQQQTTLTLDRKLLEENLLVCSEKDEDNDILVKNLASQLMQSGKKVLIIDTKSTDFDYLENTASFVTATEGFKLPLNNTSINFIYEKGLDDTKAETKALIQDIFLEVQEYIKTLPEGYIPFETFKNVVDAQYQETELVELVLLKNKLLKFYEDGIFAQDKCEIESLKLSLQSTLPTVFDISLVEENIQREMISYAYSVIRQTNQEVYVFFNISDSNSNKKLLKQIFTTKNAYSTLFCPYGYKYLKELKQISKNLILFAPIHQQNDFAGYNAFFNKLNPGEFIIYGAATHHLSLIVKLDELNFEEATSSMPIEQEQKPSEQEVLLDEQIKQDVDKIYTSPKSEQPQREPFENLVEESNLDENMDEDELTEDDLDLIDDLNISQDAILQEEEPSAEVIIDAEEEIPEEKIIEEEESFDIIEDEEAEEGTNFLSEEETPEEFASVEEPPSADILPVQMSSTPIVPIYSADVEPRTTSDDLAQGDVVVHPKYGKGTVEKLITYGSKTLCSIHFDNVGRRLLDPSLAEIKKV